MMSVLLLSCAFQVPELVTFAAFIDEGGAPVDRTVVASFVLYEHQVGGDALWREDSLLIDVVAGALVVDLGRRAPLGPALLTAPRFIEITIDGETLAPRLPWSSAPFSLSAGYAHEAARVPLEGVVGLQEGVPLYAEAVGCESPGALTLSSTCETRRCAAEFGFVTCDGEQCEPVPTTCSTTLLGRLVP